MGTPIAPGHVAPRPRDGMTDGAGGPLTRWRALSPLQMALALTALGAAIRFATLDVQSIWLDESATLILVHRGFSGMLSHLASSESTPPLYYVLVWIWTKLFGAGPIGFRSFSALAGTLTIPVLYAAGRQISPRAGLWAGALAVVNPAMYYYSQEARAYALLILLSAAAFLAWQRALAQPADRRRLALWAGMSCLAVLTHYFAAFLFVPEAIVLWRRLGWRGARLPIGAVVLVGLALAPLATRQRSDGKASWIEGSSLASRAAESVKQFLVGLNGPVQVVTALLAGLLTLAALALLLRRGDERERRGARDATIVATAAIGLPLVLAVGHAIDVYDGRNVIAALVPCALVVAIGLGVVRTPRVGALFGLPAGSLLGAGLCAVSLAVIVATNAIPGYQRDDWRGAAETLGRAAEQRAVVSEQFSSLPLSIYLPHLKTAPGDTVTAREVDFVALRIRHSTGSPTPAFVPVKPPAGFHLVSVRRREAFAVARFIAPRPTAVSIAVLRRLSGQEKGDIAVQIPPRAIGRP